MQTDSGYCSMLIKKCSSWNERGDKACLCGRKPRLLKKNIMNWSPDKLYMPRFKGLQHCKNYIARMSGFMNEADMWQNSKKYEAKVREAIALFAMNKTVDALEKAGIPENRIVQIINEIKF